MMKDSGRSPRFSRPSSEAPPVGRERAKHLLSYNAFLAMAALALLNIPALLPISRMLGRKYYDVFNEPAIAPMAVDASSGGRASRGLDFAVIGFPKTGTSFLLGVLGRHPEISMPPKEFCTIHKKDGAKRIASLMRNLTAESSGLGRQKYGIKCPSLVTFSGAIVNLAKLSDDTRLVVGVRHPVMWFQSFYNYRVWEHNTKFNHLANEVPTVNDLTKKSKQFRGLSLAAARFEMFLRQLGKVALEPGELKEMLTSDTVWPKGIAPNPFKVFIYSDAQLHDGNATRETQLRNDLQSFLGLKAPLLDFNEVPKKNAVGGLSFPGKIDICDPEYIAVRDKLLVRGRSTGEWIAKKFIKSKDVEVSNREHFVSLLRQWGRDPCWMRNSTRVDDKNTTTSPLDVIERPINSAGIE